MRLEVTENVENHQINEEYDCLLVHFEEQDALWFKNDERSIPYKGEENTDFQINWMPKFSQLLKINKKLFEIDPEFRSVLRDLVLTPADFLPENLESGSDDIPVLQSPQRSSEGKKI